MLYGRFDRGTTRRVRLYLNQLAAIDRQDNRKPGATTEFTVGLDASFMLANNLFLDGEAQASSSPQPLGCEHWLKNAL